MASLVSVALSLGILGAAPEAPGERPCVAARPAERFTIDLRDVPLATLARLVSCAAQQNLAFVPVSLAERKVTVVASRPVDLAALHALFLAVLAREELDLTRRGAYWTIRPLSRSTSSRGTR